MRRIGLSRQRGRIIAYRSPALGQFVFSYPSETDFRRPASVQQSFAIFAVDAPTGQQLLKSTYTTGSLERRRDKCTVEHDLKRFR